ncbi:thioredoxin family protein [Nicoliella lavandulae]|uniref:Thioredoxin family protein n=1 Tax=Nicoliella lavandulae TaxID=3082954 RepID=A0ABU8SKR2_9LACO
MEELAPMNLEQLTTKIAKGKYILFFTATWCPDCTVIKPAMPEIVANHPEYTFLSVDRDDNIDLAAELNIFGIPSFVAFEDGKEIGRYVNKERKTQAQVESFIDSLD